VKFSSRLPATLETNRLTSAVDQMRRDGRAFIDLTGSNPTRAGFDYPADLLAPLGNATGLEYRPSPLGIAFARKAVADDYRRQELDVSPDRLVLTASTSDAYSMLFKLLTDAGDEVLVPRPSYPLFDHLTRLDLVTPVPYDLEYHGRWSVDLDSVSRAITNRTRAVLAVSPNNPTGSFVTRDEMTRLAAMCAPRGIAIIADEVFAQYELEPGAFAAAGHAIAVHDALAFALGGLSKSVGLPQVKLGWIAAAGPTHLVDAALQRLEIICDTYLSVATPVQLALPALIARGAHVRAQIADRVRANYARVQAIVANVPSCRVLRADGGWYAILHVPSFQSEEDLVVSLLTEDGVLVHPGFFFDFPRESYLVVSLLTPDDALRDGVGRVLRHFASAAPTAHHG